MEKVLDYDRTKEKYPNIQRLMTDVHDMVANGVQDNDGVRPANIDDVKALLADDGFTIQSFANSAEIAYGLDQSFYNGLMMNYGSELSAITDTIFKGGEYMDNYRNRVMGRKLYEMENPKSALGAEFAGGAITGLGVGALANVKRAQSAIKLGIAEGAIAGSGADEDAFGRIIGTMFGAGLGGVSAGAFLGLQGLVFGIKRKFNDIIGTGYEGTTDRITKTVMDSDNVLPDTLDGQPVSSASETITRRLEDMSENMGTTSIPPDIGRNIEATAEAGVESLGPARTNAEFLEARKLGAKQRVRDKFEQTSGRSDVNVFDEKETIQQIDLPKSRPYYNKAYEYGPVKDELITDIMTQPDWQNAYQRAVKTARREGVLDENAPILPDEMPSPEEGYTVAQLDYTKRAIDSVIKANKRPDASISQTSGGLDNNDVSALIKQRDALLEKLDELVPDYKIARNKFAIGMDADRALDLGEGFLKKSIKTIRNDYEKLTEGQQKYYKLGATSAIFDYINRQPKNRNLAKNLEMNDDMMARFEMVFGTQQNFNDFIKGLQANQRSFDTARMNFGPKSARVLGIKQDIANEGESLGVEAISDMVNYGKMGLIKTPMRIGKNRIEGKTPKVLQNFGEMAFERDPKKAGKMFTDRYNRAVNASKREQELKRKGGNYGAGLLSTTVTSGVDRDPKRDTELTEFARQKLMYDFPKYLRNSP